MGMGAFFSTRVVQGESEEIKKMRIDAEWLKEKCKGYEDCRTRGGWVERWFLESANEFQKPVQGEDRDAETIRLSKTHQAMARYPNGEDEDWKKVERCLIGLSGNFEQ
jgi:hypothetical protein